jgi:tRNA 5-methylaminomethyl-2-thiouridine biosynthesis bifunctional protein
MSIAIIGAGLAGTACAYILKRAGLNPVIYEAGHQIAEGASGNSIGLVNPRFSAHRSPESDYYTSAFALAVREFSRLNDVGWRQCGALHLMVDEKKEKRFPQTAQNWGWPESEMRIVSPDEASAISGIQIRHAALYLAASGYLNPAKLCETYAHDIPIHLNTPINELEDIKADAIILACGGAVNNFKPASFIPLQSVRGQITQVRASESSPLNNLKCNLGYGGYCAPANAEGLHTLGATFQRWLDHTDLCDDDDSDNINGLKAIAPEAANHLDVINRRAALRTSAKDHFPVVGKLPGHDNIYVSTAHGSHGIISTLAAAHLIADMILERPASQSNFTINSLSPARFMEE